MKMNSSLIRLISIGSLDAIKDIYLNIFLIARIYDLADNATKTIALYYIIEYACIAITMIVGGNYFKQKPNNGLRVGMMVNLILLLFIMRLDDQIIVYYPIVACIFGIAMGTYYGPMQVLLGHFADADSVGYSTISTMLYNIVNIVFPITIGAYIETTSFFSVTLCMVVVTSIEMLLSLGISKIQNSQKCNLYAFLKVLKANRNYKIINVYVIVFLKGITSSVLDRTVLILIMMMFGSIMQLGILSTIFSIFTVTASWIVKKLCKGDIKKWLIKISAIMPILAVILLVINTSTETFILYKAVSATFICILSVLADASRYNTIGDLKKTYAAEHQNLSELSLAAGRITGLTILIIVNEFIGGLIAIKAMLLIIGMVIIAYASFIAKGQNYDNVMEVK